MTSILTGLLVMLGVGTPDVVYAQEEVLEPKEIQLEVVIDWTPERIAQEIDQQAKKYGVSAEVMKRVISCESMGSTTIQSYHRRPDGSREKSYGLAQIYLPAWPEVSKDDALNPAFAIEFMAQRFSEGREELWTCYRKLY